MKTLSVPDMHCNMCVHRIENGLKAEGISPVISLESKTVTVEDSHVAKAVEILDELGFEAKA